MVVSHLDLYRFTTVSAAEWADLEPYFDDALVFVEWPEAGAAALPDPRVAVTLTHAGDDARRITVDSPEEALLQGMG
jgi:tRNA threonylcarbamoyladenosine biosynthesis protein TsaE